MRPAYTKALWAEKQRQLCREQDRKKELAGIAEFIADATIELRRAEFAAPNHPWYIWLRDQVAIAERQAETIKEAA